MLTAHRFALPREHERLDVVLPAVDVDDHELARHLAEPRVPLHPAGQRVQTHEVEREAVVRDAATQALQVNASSDASLGVFVDLSGV